MGIAHLPGLAHTGLTELTACARTFSVIMPASLAMRMRVRGKAPLVVFQRGLGVRGVGLVVSLP